MIVFFAQELQLMWNYITCQFDEPIISVYAVRAKMNNVSWTLLLLKFSDRHYFRFCFIRIAPISIYKIERDETFYTMGSVRLVAAS